MVLSGPRFSWGSRLTYCATNLIPMKLINFTGVPISLLIDGQFETLEPEGCAYLSTRKVDIPLEGVNCIQYSGSVKGLPAAFFPDSVYIVKRNVRSRFGKLLKKWEPTSRAASLGKFRMENGNLLGALDLNFS